MRRLVLGFTVCSLVLAAGCKHHEDEAKQVGENLAINNIKAPIGRASDAAQAVEDTAPVVLDATNNVYHKPTCRNADPGSMDAMTQGAAKAKGAKADPVCYPNAQ